MKEIASLQNATVKAIRALAMRKRREEEKLFVAEGVRHVLEALACGWRIQTLVVQPDVLDWPQVQKAVALCQAAGSEILLVKKDILQKMTKRENAETVVGVIQQQWQDLASVTAADADTLWVALEQCRDPGNLGTIMRTTDAVGGQGIILIDQTCDPYSPEAVRASMGSIARMGFVRCGLPDFMAWQATWGGQIIGTHLKGAVDYRTVDYAKPTVLLMGNEQAGLTDAACDMCDTRVKIPMVGGADSLNLAVATGVMLFEMRRHALVL